MESESARFEDKPRRWPPIPRKVVFTIYRLSGAQDDSEEEGRCLTRLTLVAERIRAPHFLFPPPAQARGGPSGNWLA
jgi:hypothetical protein